MLYRPYGCNLRPLKVMKAIHIYRQCYVCYIFHSHHGEEVFKIFFFASLLVEMEEKKMNKKWCEESNRKRHQIFDALQPTPKAFFFFSSNLLGIFHRHVDMRAITITRQCIRNKKAKKN